MTFNFINIITVLSIAVTIFYLIITIRGARKEKRTDTVSTPESLKLSDYDKILKSTHWVENERERNQGEHFDDETVYLNRAKEIRESSPFFTWVKNING